MPAQQSRAAMMLEILRKQQAAAQAAPAEATAVLQATVLQPRLPAAPVTMQLPEAPVKLEMRKMPSPNITAWEERPAASVTSEEKPSFKSTIEQALQKAAQAKPQPAAGKAAQPKAPAKPSLRGVLYRKLKRTRGKALSKYPQFTISRNKQLITLPQADEVKAHSVIYPLIEPYAYANIQFDAEESVLTYHVMEPELNDYEHHVISKIKEGLIQVINVSLEDVRKYNEMISFLEENVQKLLAAYDFRLNEQEYLKIMYYIFRDFIGLNELEPLLNDPYIEDVGADGVDIPVYAVHQRYGSLRTNIIYHSEEQLKEFVTKLAERCDRYVSYAEPLLDGSLPDGTRVHASLASDVTTRGPTFSVRKFREAPFTPADMVRLNTASAELLAYLWFVVENGANILIAGGVSTGKTSILNCISLFIPPEAKVVSIEDTRELALPHENWIPGVSRTGFTSTGTGEVTMFDLLRESFRQNPDYLIVGEVRGKEAYVMFQAMASGHPSISTMHAGSVDDVMKRLQTEPINLSPGLLESLDIVIVMVHARERGKSARRVKEVVEIESVDSESGRARVSKAFVWLPSTDSIEYRGDSWVLHKIAAEKGISVQDAVREIARRKKLIAWMAEHNVMVMNDVVTYVNTYYRNPEKIKDILGQG